MLTFGNAEYADTDAIGDIMIDKDGAVVDAQSTAGITNVAIDGNGKINVTLQDGFQFVRGQILLQNFVNPSALLKGGANVYSNVGLNGTGGAGPLAVAAGATPGTGTTNVGGRANSNGLGRIDAGALELSNVDIAREFANMITTQRAFQANARVVTTSDQILQEVVRLVR